MPKLVAADHNIDQAGDLDNRSWEECLKIGEAGVNGGSNSLVIGYLQQSNCGRAMQNF